jgi:hypothetical protein
MFSRTYFAKAPIPAREFTTSMHSRPLSPAK